MDNQTAQIPQEKINLAKDLLIKGNVQSPATRLMCESIISSKSEAGIDDLILYLQEMILEKEAAYQEFKQKIAEASKDLLAK